MDETPAAADPLAVIRLATWLSPAFPVGAFAWSHGLEAAIADGTIAKGDDAAEWIAFLLDRGSGWNDLVLFAAAYRAAGDADELGRLADLGAALAGSFERRAETQGLGHAFAEAVAPWREGLSAPYPVAVAVVAAREGVPLDPALAAFANAFATNLLGAATRLVPLGQREAMRILKRLEPLLLAVAARAARSTIDDLGSAAIHAEIAAMRHETLATRLFRS